MKKIQFWKIWAIYWRDAHTDGGWSTEEEAIEKGEEDFNSLNVSFGRILKENKKWIMIYSSWTKNKQLIGDTTVIPKTLIMKKVFLKKIEF